VVVGGADTQCGLLGSGAIGPGEMGAISGTTTPVQMVTEQPLIDPEVRIWAGAHVVPGLFVLESNAGYSGGVYQWLRDAFCEKELAEEKAGRAEAYNLMNAQAAEAPPGAGGVLSFIGIMLMNAKTTGMPKNVLYMGTSPLTGEGKSTRSLIMRAVLESLAYGVRANAEQIQGVSGRQVENLRVCGGLAKGDLYLEILANVMGVPVLVPRLTEGSGSGAAICAGVGVGVYDGFAEGAKILAKEGKRIEPDERLSRQYKTFYRRWGKTRGELENLSSSF
jgi:sugar (pentulose or hexulose) kinase